MRLVLMRHAIAEAQGSGTDADRALTSEGRRKAQDVSRVLAGMDLDITHILHSPLKRAVQTAALLQDALGVARDRVVESSALLPESPPDAMVAPVRRLGAACVALVGHEPHLSRVAAWCVGGGRFDVRKSGILVLEGPGLPGADAGALVGMFAPRHLRRLVP